ncbi:hypothetical protein H0H87_005996 [Tephrocybe sp. NHM501043]|nr:hypothetical protein H0H87_005996 [Tephrocybe sp. NHM501043]
MLSTTSSVSQLLGYTSIACWLGAQFPQVIENIKRQSCEGLALPFLANWLLGDVSNLVGCILTHQLPFQVSTSITPTDPDLIRLQTYLATYFVFVDLTLVAQYFYYARITKAAPSYPHARPLPSASRTRRTSIDRGAARYRTISAVAANVAASAALAAQQEEHPDHHRRRWPVHSTSRAPIDSDDDVDDNALAALADSYHSEAGHDRRKRVSWSIERHRTRSGSLGGVLSTSHQQLPNPPSTSDLLAGRGRPLERELLEDGIEFEQEVASPGRRHSSRRTAGTMMFLGAWALFGIGTFENGRRSESTGTVLGVRSYDGQTKPLYEALMTDPLSERVIGRIFAWLCTTLYLTSRLPQIWKNFVRKSVEVSWLDMVRSDTDVVAGTVDVPVCVCVSGKRVLCGVDPELAQHAQAGARVDGVSDGKHTVGVEHRGVVLEYLAHEGYTKTAAAFARDSSVRQLDADGDETMECAELPADELADIARRSRIYHLLQAGRIAAATADPNTHFPAVLAPDTRRPPAPPTRRISDAIPYASPTSTDPLHLLINLRVQSFIEACRTRPLPDDPDTDNDDDHSSTTHDALLTKAKKLMSLAQTLPNPTDRAVYVRELRNVAALLAYPVPENSSMRKYLAQEHRDAVADQIDRAILERAGVCSVSSLELLVRYTANLWYFANKMDVKPRPGAILPPTTVPPMLETVPMFDLGVFVDHKA